MEQPLRTADPAGWTSTSTCPSKRCARAARQLVDVGGKGLQPPGRGIEGRLREWTDCPTSLKSCAAAVPVHGSWCSTSRSSPTTSDRWPDGPVRTRLPRARASFSSMILNEALFTAEHSSLVEDQRFRHAPRRPVRIRHEQSGGEPSTRTDSSRSSRSGRRTTPTRSTSPAKATWHRSPQALFPSATSPSSRGAATIGTSIMEPAAAVTRSCCARRAAAGTTPRARTPSAWNRER